MRVVTINDLPEVWLERLQELAFQFRMKDDLVFRKAWEEAKLRGWPEPQDLLCAREWARGAFVEGLHGAFYAVHGRFPVNPEEEAALSDFGVEICPMKAVPVGWDLPTK